VFDDNPDFGFEINKIFDFDFMQVNKKLLSLLKK
jgi:hypothetical protein